MLRKPNTYAIRKCSCPKRAILAKRRRGASARRPIPYHTMDIRSEVARRVKRGEKKRVFPLEIMVFVSIA